MIWIEINKNFGDQSNFLLPFIVVLFLVFLLLLFYSYKRYGIKMTCMYFLPIIIIALFIESAGVAIGRYHYPGYFLYISIFGNGGAVPIIIILGWSVNFIIFFNMGKHFVSRVYKKSNLVQIFLISITAGIFAVFLDLLEDPIAHNNRWWVWTGSIEGLKIFDVPILNFSVWFTLICYMSLATMLIERSKYSKNRKLLISITSISITGALILITHGLILRLFQTIGVS